MEELIEEYGNMILVELGKYLKAVVDRADAYHPVVSRAYSALSDLVERRGKRFASCCTLIVYEGYTGEIDPRILKVCSAVEMYRHSILIHDDLADGDEQRRGGATVHRLLADGFDSSFGNRASIFLGDMAFSLTLELLGSSGFPAKKISRSMLLVSDEYRKVNESQILDVLFEYKVDVDLDEWEVMASQRAASLFEVALSLGGLFANAPERDFPKLARAARHMGYAFDIQDDIIDTYAEEEEYGRPPCRDIASGKKPLHIALTLRSQPPWPSTIRSLIGKRELDQSDVKRIREVVERSGALSQAKKRIHTHIEDAKDAISSTSMSSRSKGLLEYLLGYIEESLSWYV